jgi:hypothetical protein
LEEADTVEVIVVEGAVDMDFGSSMTSRRGGARVLGHIIDGEMVLTGGHPSLGHGLPLGWSDSSMSRAKSRGTW